jgi:glyoxylate reductase
VVAHLAVGFNNIDLGSRPRHGVDVTNTPDVLTDATADLTMDPFAQLRQATPGGGTAPPSGQVQGWCIPDALGGRPQGKTLGIYGVCRIGQAVAKRGRGWDMKVLYHNRARLSPQREVN